jgi:hypothetical protein
VVVDVTKHFEGSDISTVSALFGAHRSHVLMRRELGFNVSSQTTPNRRIYLTMHFLKATLSNSEIVSWLERFSREISLNPSEPPALASMWMVLSPPEELVPFPKSFSTFSCLFRYD